MDYYSALLTDNANLMASSTHEGFASVRVVPWSPRGLPPVGGNFQAILGPDDCGMPNREKFFRGFKLYGQPGSSVFYFAFVDGVLIKSGTMGIQDDAPHTNIASFPRGTSGLLVSLVFSCGGRLDEAAILYDAMGALEEA